MKSTVIVSAIGLFAGGLLSAQGLYNMMPFGGEPDESNPLSWTVTGNVGWDSNPSPGFSDCAGVASDEVLYVSGAVKGSFANRTPQTTWDVWAQVGVLYYLDDITQTLSAPQTTPGTTTANDDVFPNFHGGVNFTHRVNELLRIRSRNNFGYELEPDFDYGLATDRRNGSYFRYSSDNSVGYRWTERLATNSGYRISGVVYDEVDGQDYIRHLFYNQFRYRASPATVLTATYRYQLQSNDSSSDSDSHFFLVGAEHEVSPTTVVVLRGGAQLFSPDRGASSTSPYVEALIRTALSEQANAQVFVRYGLEDRNRKILTHNCNMPIAIGHYDERRTLRVGGQGSYIVSPKVTVFSGVNVVWTEYDGLDVTKSSGAASPASLSSAIFNASLGASVEVLENLFATASYNFTQSNDDASIRDYDRHRVQVGVRANF